MTYLVVTTEGDILVVNADEITDDVLTSHLGEDHQSMPVPDGLYVDAYAVPHKPRPNGTRPKMNPKATRLLAAAMWPGENITGDLVVTGPDRSSLDDEDITVLRGLLHG